MSPTVIQEIETPRPNTSSQNITEKEIKNLSKFFVLNLKLKIKPKHLRGPDGTLRLKCTAEESCVSAEIISLFLSSIPGIGSLLEECRGLIDGGEKLSSSSSLVLTSIRHRSRLCSSPHTKTDHFYLFNSDFFLFSKLNDKLYVLSFIGILYISVEQGHSKM